jgi:diguanylate cyclase (GGDEF)-like protein
MALDALQSIPQPPAAVIEPRVLASYGAAMAAALLGVLYVYRGRAFIVYWIVGWLLLAASLYLASLGFRDTLAGGVVMGLGQLLAIWSAGLLLLGAEAFPDAPLRWTAAIKIAAVTAVWFLVSPVAIPFHIVFVTGAVGSAFLLTWSGLFYLQLFKRTRHVGSAMIGIGMGVLAVSSVVVAAFTLDGAITGAMQNRALAFNAVVNIFVALGMHLLVFEDMTSELRRANRELAAANEEVRRLAITDALTGCHNRRFFDQIERRELQRHRRYGSPLSVMFADVNRLKQLNDTLGHEAGDAALRAIGELLRRNLRGSDYVIRWGGDEFLLLLTCTFSQAQHKAAELKAAFAADAATSALPGGVGLSIGAAQVALDAQDLNDALRLADQRMYDDKFAARARIAT